MFEYVHYMFFSDDIDVIHMHFLQAIQASNDIYKNLKIRDTKLSIIKPKTTNINANWITLQNVMKDAMKNTWNYKCITLLMITFTSPQVCRLSCSLRGRVSDPYTRFQQALPGLLHRIADGQGCVFH